MASWTLTTEALPIFASKNYLHQDAIDYGTFDATEMDALLDRVIDGDPFSYWQGSTSSDLTEVTLTFSFNEGSALQARSPDLIALQNINWKNFVGEWSTDAATWTTIATLNYADGVANNALTDLIVNPSDVISAKYIRFRVLKTIVANAKKICGGVVFCLGSVQPAGGFADFRVKLRGSVRELELGDKTISREYIMRSAASYEFWGASFDLLNVTTAELALLRTIKRDGYPFILMTEPGDLKREVYLCHFDGEWGHGYESVVRSIGYRVPMRVKEVGSH